MQIEGMQPEVRQRLHELAEAEQVSDRRPINEIISDYMANAERDEFTVQLIRRIFEEDAEFFEVLGDR